MPEDAAKHPAEIMLPTSKSTVEAMRARRAGRPGQGRSSSALKRIGGEGELEWFTWFFDQGCMPWEEEIRRMELFAGAHHPGLPLSGAPSAISRVKIEAHPARQDTRRAGCGRGRPAREFPLPISRCGPRQLDS